MTVVAVALLDAGGEATSCLTSDDDGATWTQRTMPQGQWSAVAWNGTVFCAVSLLYGGGPSSRAATSPDGQVWTLRALPAASYWDAVAWNGSVFCATTQSDAGRTATSPDGINWTPGTSIAPQNGSSNWWEICGGPGHLIASNGNSSTLARSTDNAASWTYHVLPGVLVASTICRAVMSPSEIVVVTHTNDVGWRSTDEGATWAKVVGIGLNPVPGNVPGAHGLAWNGSVFCVVAEGGSPRMSAVSPTGAAGTWTSGGTGLGARNWWSTVWSGARFVTFPTGQVGFCAHSSDGLTWTEVAVSAAYYWTSLAASVAAAPTFPPWLPLILGRRVV